MTEPLDRPPNENYVRAMLDNAARGDPRRADRIRRRRIFAFLVGALCAAILITTVVVVVIITSRSDSPGAGGSVPGGFTAEDVTFIDATHGWALGKCATGEAGDCAEVLRTVDGGQRWQASAAHSSAAPSTGLALCASPVRPGVTCINDLTFATALIGYAWSSNAFFMTMDAGDSWTQLPNASAEQVVVADGRVLRISEPADCADPCALVAYSALVGTTNWSLVTPKTDEPIDSSTSALTTDGHTLDLLADLSSADATSPYLIYRSDDVEAWRRVTSNLCNDSGEAIDLSSAPDGALALSCGGSLNRITGATTPSVRISTDGGETFGAAHNLPGTGLLRSVAASSATKLICVAADESSIATYVSINGGASWRQAANDTGLEKTGGALAINFAAATFAYRVSNDGSAVWISNDGGSNWSRHRF